MNKKQLSVGLFFLLLFSPVLLLGMLYAVVEAYFVAGQGVAGEVTEWIIDKLKD